MGGELRMQVKLPLWHKKGLSWAIHEGNQRKMGKFLRRKQNENIMS